MHTERDVDILFADMLATFETEHPNLARAAKLAGVVFEGFDLESLNPITTAGSMQVSVRFAEQWADDHHIDPETARDALYTRDGGVYYGVARLLGYEAGYSDMKYRFADYNAGMYASRNAAVQRQLARLTGLQLAEDGDLLRYDKHDRPTDEDTASLQALLAFRRKYAPDLSEGRIRRDARAEKSIDFEQTETYRAVKRAYEQRFGNPQYAVVPDVTIESPKMRSKRSTAWYATSLDARYDRCLSIKL